MNLNSRDATVDFFDKKIPQKSSKTTKNDDMLFSNSVLCIAFVDSAKTRKSLSAGPGHGFLEPRGSPSIVQASAKGKGIPKKQKQKNKKKEDNLPSRGAEELKNIDTYTIQLMSKR